VFYDSLRPKYAVLLSSINVKAAILEEARAYALWLFECILARIKDIKNVFPVPLGTSKK